MTSERPTSSSRRSRTASIAGRLPLLPMSAAQRADRTQTTVVIADDHTVVRQGLRMLIDNEDGLQVIAEAGTVPDAERLTRAHRPTVLVLDLNMPGGSSLEAIPRLKGETAVVVLTMQDDPAFARQALQAGALGFVLKEAADEELLEAIRLAAAGDTYLNPRLGAQIAAAPSEPAGPPDDLTAARGRRPAADRARPHQRRDRRAALPLHAHGRDPPRPHPAEAAPHHPRRARPLRARARPRRRLSELDCIRRALSAL